MKEKPSSTVRRGDSDDQTLLVTLTDQHAANTPYAGAAQYQVPLVCTCCLKPTAARVVLEWDEQYENVVGSERILVKRSAGMSIFVCEECQAHERDYLRKRSILIRMTIVLTSLVAMALLYIVSTRFAYLLNPALLVAQVGLAAAVIAVMIIIALSLVLRLPALGPHHASRTRGVVMHGPRRFEFDNLQYGRAFASANSERYSVRRKRRTTYFTNKVRGHSMLEGKPFVTIFSIAVPASIAVTLLQSFLIGQLTDSIPHDQAALWYRGVAFIVVYLMTLFLGQKYAPPNRAETKFPGVDDAESV